MKTKQFLLLIFFLVSAFSLKGQVTVGSGVAPEKAAILDIKTEDGGEGDISSKSGGLLLPRVEIEAIDDINVFEDVQPIVSVADKRRHKGLTVYNIQEDQEKNLEEGIYVWNGERWRSPLNFFYMPSIMVPTATAGGPYTIDLYQKYKDQFKTPKVHNPSAPDIIPFFVKNTDLHYYITDYDATVFRTGSLSVSDQGVFSYEVLAPATTGTSYINIIFVIK